MWFATETDGFGDTRAASTFGPVPPDIVPASPPRYAETKDQAIDREGHELLEYLEETRRPLLEQHRALHTAVRLGDPAEETVDYARRNKFELIIMATHGRSGLRDVLHGSVTAAVIRSAVAPVLVVRPARR